jgi:predicted outer membrane protein
MIVVLLGSCASNLSYQQAMDKNRRSLDDMNRLADAQFLVEAQSFNLLEKSINELAIKNGYSSELVNYGKKSFKKHDELENELSKLSRKEKIKVPSGMKDEHQRIYDDLAATGRADFDKTYVDVLQEVNEDNIELLEEQSSKAFDDDIRAFAARKLGMLRASITALDNIDDRLMHTQR